MTDPRPAGLLAELWFAEAPDLADPALLSALRAVSPEAESQQGSLVVPHPRTGRTPLLTVVSAASPIGTGGKVRPDVGQTWDWAEAEAAVAAAQTSVLVSEMFADPLPAPGTSPGTTADDEARARAQRLTAVTSVIEAVAAATAPVAVSWPVSQRVADPALVVPGALDGPVNVRLFTDARDADVMVMDTLGLHVFGLPDLQCHFRDRPPGEIAALLFATAQYVFDEGDVVADADTISGPREGERIRCFHEPSLLAPSRTVIDLDLGDPYAAGARERGK